MRRFIAARTCMVIALLSMSAAVFGQSQTGNLVGKVTDNQGGPLPGVVLTLEGDRGAKNGVTNEDGVFRFPVLESGEYTLTAALTGMRTSKRTVLINVGKNTTVDIKLAPDTVTETLVVTGESRLVDVSNASIGGNLDVETFDSVAVGRSYQSVTQLMPGVTGGGNPNVNGALSSDNLYLVDGVNITDPTTQTFGMNLNYDAIQEVEVITGAASAEFGQSTGAIINVVTKSGTNTFEGSFRWVMTNEDWNSQSPFDTVDPEDEIIDIPTWTLGGPILRDKLWFFGAFEEGTSSSQRAIATGDNYPRDFTNTYQSFKLTWAPAQNHTVALAYSEDPASVPRDYWGNAGDLSVINNQTQGGDTYSLRWDWIISDAWYSEVRVGTQDSGISVGPSPFASPDPNLETGFYRDLNNNWGYNAPVFDGAVERPRDQFAIGITHFTSYGHEFKAGLDWQETESTNRFDRFGNNYHFGRGFDRNAPGGFTDPSFVRRYVPSDALTSTNTQLAFYLQDTFTVGENWTFKLGVRVEDQEGVNDADEIVIDSMDVAPRMTVAYDVYGDSTLAIIGSYGRYYSPIVQSLVDNFNRGIGPGAIYEDFSWNPETNRYDIGQGVVDNSGNNRVINQIDPYYEDEITLGVEYQLNPLWVTKAKLILSDVNNIFDTVDDYDADGNVTSTFGIIEDAEREYTGVQLEWGRRMVNNWMIAGNLVFGDTEGNFFDESDDSYGDFRSVSDLAVRNRYGSPSYNVEREMKMWGQYRLELGANNQILFGGNFNLETGENWALTQVSFVPLADGSGPSTNSVTEYLEPRGSNTLPTFWALDLSATWEFSFWRSLRTSIKIESFNVTNNDKQIDVDTITGEARDSRSFYQTPRSFRLVAGVRF